MRVVRTEYSVEGGLPVVYVFLRDGKRQVLKDSSLVPYFYVSEGEKNNLKSIRTQPAPDAVDGTKLVRVLVTLPSDVPLLREKFSHTWEADVLFPTRYLINKIDTIDATDLKVAFIDIETDSSGRVPSAELVPEPVICVTIHVDGCYTSFVFREDLSQGTEHRIFNGYLHEIRYYRTENELLSSIVKFLSDEGPDVISGWNCVRFDLPYLVNRMKRLGIESKTLSPMGSVYINDKNEVVIKGLAIVDQLDAYRRFSGDGIETSYKLDFIGRKVTGLGKTESGSNIKWMLKYALDKLVDYNAQDTRICVEIDRKLRLIEFMDELRRLCFCQLEDTLVVSKMLDSYILRFFHGKKVFPTKTHHEKKTFEGAMVESLSSGVHENVAVFDLKSLYPSILVSCNLSPETIDPGGDLKLGDIGVRTTQVGLLPQVVESLFQERARYKTLMRAEVLDSEKYNFYDLRQKATKILLNAIYGQTAYQNSRIHNPKVAEAITFMGRNILRWSREFLEGLGYKVIYYDTDSCHCEFDELDFELMKAVLSLLNDSYNEFASNFGLKTHRFEMEFDKVYQRAFYSHTKKRYAGEICYKDGKETTKLDIWGFEVRRSDASDFSRNLQRTVLDMLLGQGLPKDDILRYVGSEISRVREGRFSFSELGIPKAINKDMAEYKNPSANIRGAKYARDVLGIELSTKPKMVYISKLPEKYPPIDVLCFDEDSQIPPGTVLDTEKMLEKLVKDKLDSIFEALGWNIKDLSYWWEGKPKKGGEQLVMELY